MNFKVIEKKSDLVIEVTGAEPLNYSDDLVDGMIRIEQIRVAVRDATTTVTVEGPVLGEDGEPINPKWSAKDSYEGILVYHLPRENNDIPIWLLDAVRRLSA